MNRTDIINGLIARRGYRSYLEVGVGYAHTNFARIACERKCGVEPDPRLPGIDHRVRSDEFFADCAESFDFIFIDGFHEETQVGRDIRNALEHLNPGGVVLIHDCLPPDAWHQRPPSEYRNGEFWNGTVWKAALREFARSPWECYVVDCDWGCGLIDTANPRRSPRFEVPDSLDYERHFPLMREFTRSEAWFLASWGGDAIP